MTEKTVSNRFSLHKKWGIEVLGHKKLNEGLQLYRILDNAVSTETKISVDFSFITDVSYEFLHAAFSRLYRKYSKEQIDPYVTIVNVYPDLRSKVSLAKSTGLLYYNDYEFNGSIKALVSLDGVKDNI